jgi:phosphatidylglycerol---prolipoprotein diacylglyceryl transferase
MFPDLGGFGPFTLHSFGLMAGLALLVAFRFVAIDLGERGFDPKFAVELLLAAGIGGFIGARLYWVIDNGGTGGNGLISGTGLTWYGGLFGGTAAVVLVSLVRHIPLGITANIAGPAVAIGQCIGRIGCQLAGDGDYGSPTSLPWGMSYPKGTVPTTQVVHPTPLYESFTLLVIFYVLWRVRGRITAPWAIFGLYLTLSGVLRFLVEFVRTNPTVGLGLTTAQFISIASIAIGLAILSRTARRQEPTGRQTLHSPGSPTARG